MWPGRGLLPLSPPRGGEGDGENDREGVGKRGVYRPDAEKGWKDGKPGKNDGIYSQDGVGQERWGIESGGFHVREG